jgi:hypothetical protein
MPKKIIPLTDIKAKSAAAKDAPYKLTDGGLYLMVGKDGSKLWRMDYRFNEKRLRCLSVNILMSHWPARAKRAEAKEQIASGIDPSDLRRSERAPASKRGGG